MSTTVKLLSQNNLPLKKSILSLDNLTYLKLQNAGNNEILQAIKDNCKDLTVLILSQNKSLDNESAKILSGTHEYIIKGPLKVVKKKLNPQKNYTLTILDIQNTSINEEGMQTLSLNLPKCSIIRRQNKTKVKRGSELKKLKIPF